MKRNIKIQALLKNDRFFNEELNEVIRQVIFSKISLLEDYYLKEVRCYPDEILGYLRFLRENIVLFKSKYNSWAESWIKEIKPYILEHFHDEKLLHERKYNDRNLYDCLHDIAKFSDLHNY